MVASFGLPEIIVAVVLLGSLAVVVWLAVRLWRSIRR
jgi:hypothetical protein